MKSTVDQEIRELLSKHYPCYVLITCDQPEASGQMQVEMTYEGDPVLAAYLLQGAQSFMDEEDAGELDEDILLS